MTAMILVAHIAAAILASWRITELLTLDRITERLRKRFTSYLWNCHRCVSVWAGAWCSLVLMASLLWPLVAFLNWPFALAWLYLVHTDWIVGRRAAIQGRKFTISVQPNGNLQWSNDFSNQELEQILKVTPLGQALGAKNGGANGEAKAQ